jgi:tetratricopeptide (TPR) repeat protein
MSFRRINIMLGGAALAVALVSWPGRAAAQEEACVGTEPRGGRAVSSADLYIDRARRSAGNVENQRKLWQQGLDELERDMDENVDDPNPQVYLLAGRLYAELGQYAEADAAWTQAVNLWSCFEAKSDTLRYNAWVKVYNRAVGYARSGDTEQAREGYESAWTLYKDDPQPMLQLGSMYAQEALAAADPEEQHELNERALEHYQLAVEAINQSDRLTQQQRVNYLRPATFNLAQLLAADERFEDAAAAYARFLDFQPGDVDATSNAAVVLTRASRKYTSDAVDMEDGPEKEALLALADSLRRVAVDYYSSLVNREDLDANDYHNIGLGLSQIGLNEEAVAAFSRALDLEPYRANSLEQLALSLFRSSQYDSLVVVAKLMVERYPLNMNSLALLANAYREIEQVDSALAVLQRREEAELDLADLQFSGQEGTYTVRGTLVNMKLAGGTQVDIQFDFYDDLGEMVASETMTISTPDPGEIAPVRHSFESDALITGLTYHRVGS